MQQRKREITDEATERGQHALSVIIDAGFLVIWLMVHWGIDRLRELQPLNTVEGFIFTLFQWTIASSTLILILIWVCRDLAVIGIRAFRRVRRELNKR